MDVSKTDEITHDVLALAIDSSDIGVWVLDMQSNTQTWSKKMYALLGVEETVKPTHDTYVNLIHSDDKDRVTETVKKALYDGEPYDAEYRFHRADNGEEMWGRFIGRMEYAENGDPMRMLGAGYDITHIKNAEMRAEAAEQKAREADIAKSEFLANMSHEIRTPMNGIMGMAELLQNSDLGPRETDFVNVINRSGEALLTIINDILDFSKIESGKLELDNMPFNLRDCIEDITALLATRITETGIDLLLRVQPDLPMSYLGDAGRIRQIFTNIVGNAVKFTHDGHVLIDVGGQVHNQTAELTIKVVDTGIGIAPNKLNHVFDKFTQEDGSTTREYGGTGLGLTISRNLVELMGGTIDAQSVVGEGSTFTIQMSVPVQADIGTPAQKITNITGSKILVIDDNEVNRDILKEQLNYWSCQCVAAPSAKVGLAVLDRAKQKNIKFDLIIVDYQMPKSNGEEFVRALKSHPDHADIPAIMLSSVDRSELRQRMKTLNISAFLTKPARGSVLHNTIGDVLRGHLTKSAQGQTALQPAPQDLDEPAASGHIDVLIAEDNEVNQIYARYVMEDLGLSFKIVPNGRVAVEKWALLSPKIVLMDISMPEMNGWEATAAIRALEAKQNLPRTPIVAVTAHAMTEDKSECIAKDMDDYLSKPLSISSLKKKLKLWGGMEDMSDVGAKNMA